MGSQPSKVPILKCPKDFDPKKFKKITRLFDKLDQDSNLGVSSDEVENIAALHVENSIKKMRACVEAKNKSLKVALAANNIDKVAAEQKLKQEFALKDEHEKRVHTAAIQKLNQRIEWYESLDKDGKADAFMRVVSGKDSEHLDFWSFFEYMKTRTDDINNIEH